MGLLGDLSREISDLVARTTRGLVSLEGREGSHSSTGSGFVYDHLGHVVTNHHVVEHYTESMTAVVAGNTSQQAKIIGRDAHTDLAVVRLERPEGTPLELRRDEVALGELCLAIGTPLGIYPESVSFGVVSGVRRDIPQPGRRPLEDTLQVDVAINPGNSGGPLVDVSGRVIGVSVCIDNRGQNIGFAIPSETVAPVVTGLIADGRYRRAALGVSVSNRMVDEGTCRHPHLVVTKVSADGPAAALAVGDIIERVNDHAITERADLYRLLTKDLIGRPARLQVRRGEESHVFDVEPGELVES